MCGSGGHLWHIFRVSSAFPKSVPFQYCFKIIKSFCDSRRGRGASGGKEEGRGCRKAGRARGDHPRYEAITVIATTQGMKA
jgi:hypothetical protein